MRLLILGGTQFLGRTVAARAAAAGWHVTCAARGSSGTPPPGTTFVAIDRDRTDGLTKLDGLRFDAALELSRYPAPVRRAQAFLDGRIEHWTFVSTTSVYADPVATGQTASTATLLAPASPDLESCDGGSYGAAKVACEAAFGDEAFICRPGLIVGPGDPTGRFTYWAARLARGGDILVPASSDDPLQYVDVRDLADWIVHGSEAKLTGRFDAVGPTMTRQVFVQEGATACGAACRPVWVSEDFLSRHRVGTGSGPRSLPYPMPDSLAEGTRNVSASMAAGLTIRPFAETLRDTLSWLHSSGGPIAGLTSEEEANLLKEWRMDPD